MKHLSYIIITLFVGLSILLFSSCKKECNTCEGDGYVIRECEECEGVGYVVVECPNCSGAGYFRCRMCYGEGRTKECIWLDAIQKHRLVTPSALEILKARKLIEGRAPNYFISLAVAKKTKQVGEYTKMKGLERDKYLSMIYEFVKNGSPEGVMLNQIFDFMSEALPKNKDVKSQKRFLGYLVNILKTQDKIHSKGKRWITTTNNHKM